MSEDNIKYHFSDLQIRVNDYIEGSLSDEHEALFEEYLDVNSELKRFVAKSKSGMHSARRHFTVSAADDFEEKLQKRLAAISHSEQS